MSFVSAGHPPPILVRAEAVSELSVSGFPVGVVPQPEYELQVVQLLPGDRFYLYSDGAVEQVTATGEMFGVKQLMRKLLENRTLSLQCSIELCLGAVLNSSLNVKGSDDISMLGIELVK
jgi:sigma-B regulation protein RsbU (phosphoserine phosphatase)